MSDADQIVAIGAFLGGAKLDAHWQDIAPRLDKVLPSCRRVVILAEGAREAAKAHPELGAYAVEAVSDFLSAVGLTIIGSYKASMMVLRSSLENCARTFLLTANAEIPLSYDIKLLFSDAGKQAALVHQKLESVINNSRMEYKKLCEYVHTGKHEVMTLEARLRQFPKYEISRLNACLIRIAAAGSILVNILFYCFADRIRGMHPDTRDLVLGGVSRQLKSLR